jgi:hypothetical protein
MNEPGASLPSDRQGCAICGELAGGSEDEEYLTRLSNAEAAEYLDRPAPAA